MKKTQKIIAENVRELIKKEDKKRDRRLAKGKWGAWYITKDKKYFGVNRSYPYEILLSEIKRDGPLHWFAHLRQKTWLHKIDIADLILAFDDLFDYSWIYDDIAAARSKKI